MERRDLFTGAFVTGAAAAVLATLPSSDAMAKPPAHAGGPDDIINVRDVGAIADGQSHPIGGPGELSLADAQAKFPDVTNLLAGDETDWAAIQQAVIESKLRGNAIGPTSEKMFPVFVPTGTYVVNRTILIGSEPLPVSGPPQGEVERGFHLFGTSGKSSEIVWTGPGGDDAGPIVVNLINWFAMSDFRISVASDAGFGLWLRGSGGRIVGSSLLSNISIVGADDGLRVGFSAAGGQNSSPSQCLYQAIDISNAVNAVHIIGADTDGQYFQNLQTRDITEAVLKVENGRNVHVDGGVDFGQNNTINRRYLWTTGPAIGGGFSIKNIRIEQGGEFIRIDSGNETLSRTDPFMVVADNVVVDTAHDDLTALGAPVKLVHWATAGNLQISNCSFPQPNGYFYFPGVRSNRHTEFVLENCQIMATVGVDAFDVAQENYGGTPQDTAALIQATPQNALATEGVLRVTLRNNLFFERILTPNIRNVTSGRFRDQIRLYSPADMANDTYNLIIDDRITPLSVDNIQLIGWPTGSAVKYVFGTDRAFMFEIQSSGVSVGSPSIEIAYADGPYVGFPAFAHVNLEAVLDCGNNQRNTAELKNQALSAIAGNDKINVQLSNSTIGFCYRFTGLTKL